MKRKLLVTTLVLLSLTATVPTSALTFAERARAAYATAKAKTEHYGRKAYGYAKRGLKEGVALMAFGQNLAEEAQEALKKLSAKRDEILAMGAQAQEAYTKLVGDLQSVQQGAAALYEQGFNLAQEEANGQ